MANYHKNKDDKMRQGTFRPDREKTRSNDPLALDYCPDVPHRLKESKIGSNFWETATRFLVDHRLLHSVDLDLLEALCITLQSYWDLQEFIRINGNTYTTSRGAVHDYPQVKMAKEDLNMVLKLCKLFYLDPLSRSRLPGITNEEQDDLDRILMQN